jgi:hypothetical protein
MNKTIILQLIIFSLITLLSCEKEKNKYYSYKESSQISDLNGIPVNDSVFYFPVEVFIDSVDYTNTIDISIDSGRVKWYSRDLRNMKELVLYNYYMNKCIYRFTWLRSFDPPIIIRLEKKGDTLTLFEKELLVYKRTIILDEYTPKIGRKVIKSYKTVTDSIVLKEFESPYSLKLYQEFDSLLKKNDFLSLSTTVAWNWCTDGSEWILEVHTKDGYYVVNRFSGGGYEFREICDFLIDNSRFKDERRY